MNSPLTLGQNTASFNSNGTTLLQRQKPLRLARSPHSTPAPPPLFIYAIDHLSTKLRIPIAAVEPTQALEDDGLVPGLCRLYLEGRCRQGERCYQVHANPTVVEQLRHEAQSAPTCCHIHGAHCNYEGFPLGLTVTIEGPKDREREREMREAAALAEAKAEAKTPASGKEEVGSTGETSSNSNVGDGQPLTIRVPDYSAPRRPPTSTIISLHSLCPTSYLWSLYKENGQMHLTARRGKVCREHRRGLCRFGDECSFLHVCREIPLDFVEDNGDSMRNGSLPPHARNASMDFSNGGSPAHSYAGGAHFHSPQGGASSFHARGSSFADGAASSMGGTRLGTVTSVRSFGNLANMDGSSSASRGPLLRPLAGGNSSGNAAGMPVRQGSFSHNPYAEASSLQ